MLGFVAAPLAILWNELRDTWMLVAAIVFAAIALMLVPVDIQRGAFSASAGPHPERFKVRSMAIGALVPIVMLAAVALIYVLAD